MKSNPSPDIQGGICEKNSTERYLEIQDIFSLLENGRFSGSKLSWNVWYDYNLLGGWANSQIGNVKKLGPLQRLSKDLPTYSSPCKIDVFHRTAWLQRANSI